MHGRYLRASGLFLASMFAVWTSAFAQTPAAGTATGAQNPTATAPAGGQRPPQPQSPTFARIQSRTYDFKEAGIPMSYEVYVPTKYNSAQPTPLIVALHGLGSNPTQLIRYQGLTDLAEDRGYIVAAPMGYNSGGWYGSRGPGRPPGRGGRGDQSAVPENLGELSELDVMNVLDIVRKEFNVDPSRIYLFGHSMGGGGAYHLGMKYPEITPASSPERRRT